MRLTIKEVLEKVGETVTVSGWIHNRRDHGKLVFIDLRDRTGLLQLVGPSDILGQFKSEDIVKVTGQVNARPEKLINSKLESGKIEIFVSSAQLVSKAAPLPIDFSVAQLELNLPTLLDFRSLTLRHPKVKAIFEVQAALASAFREASLSLGCTEVFVPTISASATEGGAEVLPISYFGYDAFLVQSPQLYKQMMAGVFERVFTISHIYRAEPSITTRHLVESLQLDCEIGFIENFEELLDALESTFSNTILKAQTQCAAQLALLEVEPSKVDQKVPRLTMREAQEIIFKRTGVDHRTEKDLMPEDEREIAAWALEEHGSDLVTITHFPTLKRAFYSMPDPADPNYCLSYDLLYKGLEIASGAQRIHVYDDLVASIKSRDLDPKSFTMYLQAFEFAMPPHGGFSYGLERATMKLLNLGNIREASLFPRDMERVDLPLKVLQPDKLN